MANALPDIYKFSDSIINLAAMVNYSLRDGHPLYYQLPSNPIELTGLLGYLRMDLGQSTLSSYMDPTRERTQMTLFFSDHTSENILRIRDAAYDYFKAHPAVTDIGTFKLAGGRIGMEIALNEEMKKSHVLMDSLVLLAILIMCSIAFRSLTAGLMLTIPLILSNLIAFSYMAFTDLGLTPNTLPCSAIGVGVGVDFAIYLYSRCIEEYGYRNSYTETVLAAVRTAGKGIVFTGVTLILPLLLWYFISGLKFQAQMGFFLSMLLFVNMVGAMTLHPFLICLIKPKFMERRATACQFDTSG